MEHEASRAFHLHLLTAGEQFLREGRQDRYAILRGLHISVAENAADYLLDLTSTEFEACVCAFPRRTKPQKVLEWLGVKNTPNQILALQEYDQGRKGVADSKRQVLPPIAERLRQRFLESIAQRIGESAVRKNMVLRIMQPAGAMQVETIVDFGHRGGALSYLQNVYDEQGTVLNLLPFSILEWCGIASQTIWCDLSIERLEHTREVLVNEILRLPRLLPVYRKSQTEKGEQ